MDDHGFVDTHAYCNPPERAAALGRTAESLVAVCQLADTSYEFRGVRLSDGAALTTDDVRDEGNLFRATASDAIYTIVSEELYIAATNNRLLATEPMIEYKGPSSDAPWKGLPESAPSESNTGRSPVSTVRPTPSVSANVEYPALPVQAEGAGNGWVQFTATAPWRIRYSIACVDNTMIQGGFNPMVVTPKGSLGGAYVDMFKPGKRQDSGITDAWTQTTGHIRLSVSFVSQCSWAIQVVED